jgi:hypothetical protein
LGTGFGTGRSRNWIILTTGPRTSFPVLVMCATGIRTGTPENNDYVYFYFYF